MNCRWLNNLTAVAAAVALSVGLAACGGGSSSTATPGPMPTEQENCEAADGRWNADMTCTTAAELAAEAAQTAADAAGMAADAAEAAADAQMANSAADESSYALAQNAAERARAAADAADAAAGDANVAEAQRQQEIAEAEQAKAVMYADMVADAQQDIDDENQRVMDVADARMRAMQSYMDADADATKAEGQADAAEAAAPGSPGAMAARTAATAARTAADAAKAAHDAIMDGMSKADADAQADMAAMEAGNANSSYMTAKAENDTIQTNVATNEELQRQRDIAAATTAASEAATDARAAATAARMSATSARTAATAANMAYMRAMAARTDSDAAKMEADAAGAAATAAENAAMMAEAAANAAEAAHMGIDASGSGADAKAAQMTAETEQGKAETARDTASTQYMTAMTASGDAATAASVHVLQLFMAANGAHVTDGDDDGTSATEEMTEHANNVGAAMAHAAAAASGAQATGATNADTFTAGGALTAAAVWLGDTVDDPSTEADESVENNLSINIGVNGGSVLPFRLAAVADNPDTDGTDETAPQTARKIADLGDFDGYEIWEAADATDTTREGARVIVFTNKQQGDDSKLAVVGGSARSVSGQATPAPGELSNVRSTGDTIPGVTWTPSGEAPLTGTLNCPSSTACNIVLGEDGAVTTITGYTFTGSRGAVEAVTATDAADDNDYLMFGLWLDENDDGTTDTFGAFAVGGTDYAVNVANAVTGTATYSGKAAGAHHKTGDGVNWFHGDARLTANFDDATEPGNISGAIRNIRVAGGAAMSAPIYLGQADLSDGSAIFNGKAFMGAPTAPGAMTHEFDGTWSGSFFGSTTNDPDTADVDESITAPKAAAGTFGVTKSEGTGDDMIVESFVGAFGAHKQ